MNGIATFLIDPHKTQVETLWRELEERCGLVGVKITPFPHFSYQVVEDYDQSRLEPILREIARNTHPFTVRTGGLGLFTGENPIIYLTLVKDAPLLCFHRMIWDRTKEVATGANPYYAPDLWVPHITLAYGDVDRSKLNCAMDFLASQPFEWEICVDNLAFVGQPDSLTGERYCIYRFGE
jgi:2'-5' RNA ligase